MRESRDLSQIALAAQAGLTRQSVGAIEAGRATPSVHVALRIARALGCRVEELFGASDAEGEMQAELAGVRTTRRVALANIGERWVALPLCGDSLRTAADGLVVKTRGTCATVAPVRPLAAARENVVMMGCATGLGLLADRLNTQRGAGRFLWLQSSSGAALTALSRGLTHIAGIHWVDTRNEDANVETVRRIASRHTLTVVTLARWQAGLLTRKDDAERIKGIADVTARDVRLIVREHGAGARRLLDQQLHSAGISTKIARKAPFTATGHVEVARAIAMGAADVGVATHDVALCFGLRFLRLAEERYDLVLPQALLQDPRIARLLDLLVSQPARRELKSLGYDVTSSGKHVTDVSAA